MGVLSY
jgi:hypothetical protein